MTVVTATLATATSATTTAASATGSAIVHPLSASRRPEILEHLLRLAPEDRRLRFGVAVPDATIAAYVDRIDFERDAVFGVHDDAGALVGVTHVARCDEAVELGLSVHAEQRGRGLAQAMFRRAILHARNRGVGELFMHCLSENAVMMHIARKAGMRIVIDGADRDASLALPPATPLSVGKEFYEGQLVLLDWALRASLAGGRNEDAGAGGMLGDPPPGASPCSVQSSPPAAAAAPSPSGALSDDPSP